MILFFNKRNGENKNEKGITLIALIITIIVMLILVGVTINVALDGGIFDKAKDATQKTSREVSREQIVAAMVGAYDNNGNFVKANAELPEEIKWCSKDENYSNASGEGNNIYLYTDNIYYVEAGILKMFQIELDSGIYTWLCND